MSRPRVLRRAVERLLRLSLTGVDLLLRRYGYRRTYALLRRTSPSPRRVAGSRARHRGEVVARLVLSAAVDRDRTCLRRALLSWWVNRWLGVGLEVRFGVRLDGGSGSAHAWLERDGRPFVERADIAELFPLSHSGDLDAERAVAG